MIAPCRKRVLLGGYIDDLPDEDILRFHLTYEGPLPSTPKDDCKGEPRNRALLKHKMRQHFHAQIKRLWHVHPALKGWEIEDTEKARQWRYGSSRGMRSGRVIIENRPDPGKFGKKPIRANLVPMYEAMGNQFQSLGYRFTPLVWEEIDLLCSIDVLFLRRGRPGNLFSEGDVDNRMKTLIDTLRKPRNMNELAGHTPEAGEDPFFCLLEDDKFLSKFSVDTDDLLDPLGDDHKDATRARLIISVEIRPWSVKHINAHLF